MPNFTFLIIIAALVLLYVMRAKRQTARSRAPLRLHRKPVMTAREQQMYHLLQTALPECTVLAQVAFSALVTAKGWANRNRFDRKVADFVLCSQQLNVIAIIELDDSSHAGRERQDQERDGPAGDQCAPCRGTSLRRPRRGGSPEERHAGCGC